jgi:hypothetical protein
MRDPYQNSPRFESNSLKVLVNKRGLQKLVLGLIFAFFLILPIVGYIVFSQFFGEKARAGGLPESFNLSSSTTSSITTNP